MGAFVSGRASTSDPSQNCSWQPSSEALLLTWKLQVSDINLYAPLKPQCEVIRPDVAGSNRARQRHGAEVPMPRPTAQKKRPQQGDDAWPLFIGCYGGHSP